MTRFEYVWSALIAALIVAVAVTWAMVSLEVEPSTPEQVVQDFVSAYNSRDLGCMLALATEDVQWMNVSDTGVSVETRGRDALRDTTERPLSLCLPRALRSTTRSLSQDDDALSATSVGRLRRVGPPS